MSCHVAWRSPGVEAISSSEFLCDVAAGSCGEIRGALHNQTVLEMSALSAAIFMGKSTLAPPNGSCPI